MYKKQDIFFSPKTAGSCMVTCMTVSSYDGLASVDAIDRVEAGELGGCKLSTHVVEEILEEKKTQLKYKNSMWYYAVKYTEHRVSIDTD